MDPRVRLHLEAGLAHQRALLERQQALLAVTRRDTPARAARQSPFEGSLRRALDPEPARPSPEPGDEAGRGDPGRREEVFHYRVRPGDTLWALATGRFHVDVAALARANGVTHPERLRPGQLLRVERVVDSRPRRVVASWYGPGFDGRPMANGRPYDRHAATIAHRTLPLGVHVELRNPTTGVTVRARVTDRGPYVAGRDVDLSWRLARDLDLLGPGVGELEMRVLG